jgi:release factor glutamine methyltransferase
MISKNIDLYRNKIADIYGQSEARAIVITTVRHYTGLSLAEILSGKTTDADTETKIVEALNQVLSLRPIQYILGETEFYGRTFVVNENVLIPRCETEELVALVVGEHRRSAATNIIDLGTGSGCIAVSLACEMPAAAVYAIDISPEALTVAATNSNRNHASVTFAEYDMLGNSAFPYDVQFNVIVSNPPYVRMSERQSMDANVLEHEPPTALFVADDAPLVYYEACLRFADRYLAKRGSIYVEINEFLGEETLSLFRSHDFDARPIRDIAGKNRFIKAIKS